MVFEVRDMWPDVPIALKVISNPVVVFLARRLEKFAYSRAAHIVALAPGMKDDIARKIGSSVSISVVPNGCDIELFSERADSEEVDAYESFIGGRKVLL